MISNEDIERLREYFAAKGEVLSSLPAAAEVNDLVEVVIKNSDATYSLYKMVEGNWKKINDLT